MAGYSIVDGPFTTVAAAAARLRDGTTNPLRLTDEALAAIEASQPTLNAFVTVDPDGARAAARSGNVDGEGTRRPARGGRGALAGIPVAVKDVVDTAGLRTTMGSRHFADHVPARDAEAVRRLREAGAIIVGKTTTHEFAYGPTGDVTATGPAANPHDPARMAGGSSAGSAAAVAAGLVPLAVGTDTGGSVRIPAALCGVVGIRPTMGAVPVDGVFPLAWTYDTVGVLAADVAGTATGWAVLTGSPVSTVESTLDRVSTMDIGIPAGFNRLAPEVAERFDALVTRLRQAGLTVSSVDMGDVDELLALYRTVQSVEAVSIHLMRLETAPELFEPETAQRLRVAAEVPAHAYARALVRVAVLRAGAARRFAGRRFLLTPTLPIVAPPIGARDVDLGGGWTSPRDALLAHTAPWSVLGVPSLSLPIPGPGLPVGAQLIAGPGEDARLLAAATLIERLLRPA